MLKKSTFLLFTSCFLLFTFLTGCSNEKEFGGKRKTDAVTKPTPKVAPYITEYRYLFAGMEEPFRVIINNVKSSVVALSILKSGTGGIQFSNIASGVIIDPRGYVLTTNQALSDLPSGLKVTLFKPGHRHQFNGVIVAQDSATNLALVKIQSPDFFPFTPLGNSALVKHGDWLLAFCSADGLNQKIVPGIVGSTDRSAKIAGKTYRNLIQTDVRMEKGCIGGPFVDVQGRVVGINLGKGLVLPVNQAAFLLSCIDVSPLAFQKKETELPAGQPIADKQELFFTWLGAEVIPIDENIAHQMNLSRRGLLVNRVLSDSPAHRSGLKRGDVIIKFNRQRVGNIKKLKRIISRIRPGKVVPLKIDRRGVKKTLQVQIVDRPDKVQLPIITGPVSERQISWYGIEIANLTPEFVRRFDISADEQGVVVIAVEDAAIQTGLSKGDLIVRINGRKIGEIGQFLAIASQSKKGVLLDIFRKGEPLYITVRK